MKCPECQFDNRDGVKFCEECGKKLELSCPNCGKKVPLGRKFCGECGATLSGSEKSPPPLDSLDYNRPHSYTPKHLADKILSTKSSLEGERKLVTVLFADVVDSTAMFGKLDPEDVHQILDGYFKILMEEIHRYEGTINQFTGDGVMAIFGAPIAHEDHAQRACHASLAIQQAVTPYAEKLGRDYGIEFRTRIGLNSGPVVVGSIGDDLRMDYTAQGDTTNLGSRMETGAEPGTVLASGSTYKLARNFFEFAPRGHIQVKGKQEGVEAYRLLKPGEARSRIDASTARGLTRFVGRKRELETLKEAFDKARSGQGQVVGIVGEAGVGKSRLLLELRNALPQGEFNYFEGRCLHYGNSMPYLPMLDIFRSYIGVKEGDPEPVVRKKMRDRILGLDENLRNLIPPFQELLSLRVDDEAYANLEPKQKRERTFEAIRDLLIRGSQVRPLIVAVEDLHWIDKTSEEFLGYMIDWLPKANILLLLLYRPEYTHPWGSKSCYSKVGVDQLPQPKSADLVRAILEGGDVSRDVRDLILGRASGNPFFMEELTLSLLENGSVLKKEDRYVLSAKSSGIHLPDTIQGIIAARMDRLEESLKRIMQVASVIGREFAFRILHAVTDMKEDLKSGLLNLQGLEFIYEKSLFPELEYVFRHALTQEVAYGSLLQKRRKEIHQRIGAAIEQLYPDRLQEFYEMLAYHYARAESPDKAYQYQNLSAQKAARNNAVSESFGFYKEAVRTLKRLPESENNKRELIRLIISMDTPMRLLAYPEECLEYFQEGERASKELGDDRSLATFYSLMGIYYTFHGDPLRGVEYSEKCVREAMKHEDVDLIAPMALELCVACDASGDYLKIMDLAPYVIELLEKKKKEWEFFDRAFHPYSSLQLYYGISLEYSGRFDEAKAVLEKALASSLKIRHLATLSFAELILSAHFGNMGEGKEALKHAREALRYSQEGNLPHMAAFAYALLACPYLLSSQPEAALEHAQKGYAMATEIGVVLSSAVFPMYLGFIYFDLGNLEESEKYMQQCKELSRRIHCKQWHAYAKMHLGRIWSRRDPSLSSSAEEYILEGMGVLEGLGIKSFLPTGHLFLGELYARTGEHEKSLKHLSEAEKGFQEMGPAGNQYWLRQTREAVERVRG